MLGEDPNHFFYIVGTFVFSQNNPDPGPLIYYQHTFENQFIPNIFLKDMLSEYRRILNFPNFGNVGKGGGGPTRDEDPFNKSLENLVYETKIYQKA